MALELARFVSKTAGAVVAWLALAWQWHPSSFEVEFRNNRLRNSSTTSRKLGLRLGDSTRLLLLRGGVRLLLLLHTCTVGESFQNVYSMSIHVDGRGGSLSSRSTWGLRVTTTGIISSTGLGACIAVTCCWDTFTYRLTWSFHVTEPPVAALLIVLLLGEGTLKTNCLMRSNGEVGACSFALTTDCVVATATRPPLV